MNSILLKGFSRFDALPRGGNFDQDTVITDSRVVVEANKFPTFFNGGLCVVTEAGINLS